MAASVACTLGPSPEREALFLGLTIRTGQPGHAGDLQGGRNRVSGTDRSDGGGGSSQGSKGSHSVVGMGGR